MRARSLLMHTRSPRNKAGGFSLIEVLVALLVLSIGLLGLAALQAVALKANHGAYQRSQATFLAYDIIDRMRANRQAALTGSYNLAMPAAPAGGATLAAQDLNDWMNNFVTVLLPVGDGSVNCVDGDGDGLNELCTVIMQWDEGRLGGSATTAGNLVQFAFTAQI